MNYPKTLPAAHKQLLLRILDTLCQDQRILGIAASGSFAADAMDEYSDLDLVIAVEPNQYDEVMACRFAIVDKIDGKIAAFTGEHVGEPRLVIALYEPGLIHVDFKFVSLPDAAQRVDATKVLWQRDEKLTEVYKHSSYQYPQPDINWIEDRFWIWIHYGAGKIARGELFEALEFLSFLRSTVLAPLALKQQGLTPSGVRTIEKRIPGFSKRLQQTVATCDKDSLTAAFRQCIALYIELRRNEDVVVDDIAQQRVLAYFENELGV